MTTSPPSLSRGQRWLAALCGGAARLDTGLASVQAAEAALGEESASFIAVVPDPDSRFPRARHGEVGLAEAWCLARLVHGLVAQDRAQARKRPIIAVVDVPSQAYGRLEEQIGLNWACAAAAQAYAQARLAGHPVVALLVGKAMSGAFLAHGYQANRLVALDDPGVLVHAMGKASAARVTQRSEAELDALGKTVLPMSYGIAEYAQLGLLHALVRGVSADAPDAAAVHKVSQVLQAAVQDVRQSGRTDLSTRWTSAQAQVHRRASRAVREALAREWAQVEA